MRHRKGGSVMNISKFKDMLKEKGVTNDYIARILNINPSTLYRRFATNGDSFTIGEIHSMVDKIPLSTEEAIEIFLPAKSH